MSLAWGLGALSGASALAAGGYGFHAIGKDNKYDLEVYKTANEYHMINSVGLMLASSAASPLLSGALFVGGIGMFSGVLYARVIQKDHSIGANIPQYGGGALIAAWASMILRKIPK